MVLASAVEAVRQLQGASTADLAVKSFAAEHGSRRREGAHGRHRRLEGTQVAARAIGVSYSVTTVDPSDGLIAIIIAASVSVGVWDLLCLTGLFSRFPSPTKLELARLIYRHITEAKSNHTDANH